MPSIVIISSPALRLFLALLKHKGPKVEAVKTRLGLPFGFLYSRFCLFSQAQIKNFAKLDLSLHLQHFARAFHDFAHECVFQSAAGIMPEHIIVVNLLRHDRVVDALHFLGERDGLRGILPIIEMSLDGHAERRAAWHGPAS